VRGGEQEAVALAEEDVGAHAGGRGVGVKEAAGDFAGEECGELRRSRGLGKLEADAGMAAVKLTDERREHRRHGEAGEGDAHVPDLSAGESLEIARDSGEGTELGLDPLEEEFPGRRDFDTAPRAVKEVGVEGGFELSYGAAEGGLGDAEGLGSFAKMELAGDLAEIDEVTELEWELILSRHHRGLNKYFPVMARIW
jgi:hypothetical protein